MAHTKKKKRKEPDSIHIGFQIAPMIDVVFVIMLFFMVMAGQVQVEHELNLKLPGAPSTSVETIEEGQIRVLESGEVLFNEEEVGGPTDVKLISLYSTMKRMKESADAASSKVVVTIQADEYAPYQRVVDVLNTLSSAQIKNVTFEVAE